MINKGLVVLKLIFRICTKSKRLINKRTCLVFIVGSSFLETYTRTPQQIRISKKFIITVLKKIKFCIGFVTSSYVEIIEIIIQTIRIRKTSIFVILVNFSEGTWLLIHELFIFFNSLVRFCTEYN